MVYNLVKREVRGRYKGSVLGFIWNFITPLMQILVYVLIFTIVFKPGIDNYAIYLISGIVIWNWFAESSTEGAGMFVGNSDLVKKIYFPRAILPISLVLSKMVNFLIMLVIFFIIIVSTGFGISLEMLLYLPIAIVISLFFIIGISLLLSSLNVYLRDIQYIVTVVLMLWFWITPIMYTVKNIDDVLINTILRYNPMTYFVELFQDIFYWKTAPDVSTVLICLLLSVVSVAVGSFVFKRLEKNFAEVL